MIGPDVNNPFDANHQFSALRLKSKWQAFAEPRLQFYPDSLSRMSSFSFDGYTWKGAGKESWEISEFYYVPIGLVFTRFELYKIFIYNELCIDAYIANDQIMPELFKLKRQQLLDVYNEDLELAKQGYGTLEESQNAFMLMMALSCILTVLTFFIPKWSITEQWKMRILLFNLVIIFEFILLLTDLYLGTFSQNPLYLLAANIVLALGLVTLDNFLRNNFLKWYETKEI